MQPNQQNSSEQNQYASGSLAGNPNVPEFLHLDPVTIQEPKPSRKKLFAVIIGIFAILFAVGALAYWILMQNKPETLFYKAVANSMAAEIVKQEIKSNETSSKGSFAATATADFSNRDSIKSVMSYAYDPPKQTDSGSTKNISLEGAIAEKDNQGFYGRLTAVSRNPVSKLAVGQWYFVPLEDYKGASILDTFHLRESMHTLALGIPIGNFAADKSDKILQYMKEKNIYTVADAQDGTLNGVSVKVMTIDAADVAVSALMKQIADVLQIKLTGTVTTKNKVVSMKVWIDKDSGRFMKVQANNNPEKTDMAIYDEKTITYPGALDLPDVSRAKPAADFE